MALQPRTELDNPTSTLRQLIADCAELPASLWPPQPALPTQRAAGPWSLDERCLAQVDGLEDYGSS